MTDDAPDSTPNGPASREGKGDPGAAAGRRHPRRLVEPASARVVAVDDEQANLDLLRRILEPAGYENLVTLTDPRDVLPLCRDDEPDLLVLDLMMPHLDGFELHRRLSDELPGFAYVPVLFLTADDSRQVQEKALSLGGHDFLTKPLSPREVRIRVRNLLTTRALHRELHEMNRELDARVRKRTSELEEARIEILERLAVAAEYRDDQTGEHIRRVGRMAARLARELGLDEEDVETIRRAAPLHDVGKIGIHDSILLKNGRLTDHEFDRMETHTLIGADILGGSRFPLLRTAARIARHHHEWWNGSGYPDGLSGEEIPLAARIVAVVDVFDSLTHDRTYKEAWDESSAVAFLEKRRGEQFDPRVVEAFLEIRSDEGANGPVDLT
ncbi:MAG: HD domain-containing phosphohydrolase, partial [Gemmatimonadota bacterium]